MKKTRPSTLVTILYSEDRFTAAANWCFENCLGQIKIATQHSTLKSIEDSLRVYRKRIDRPLRKANIGSLNQALGDGQWFVTFMFGNSEDACLFIMRHESFDNTKNPTLELPYKWILYRRVKPPRYNNGAY